MNTSLIKISPFLLLLALSFASCSKEEKDQSMLEVFKDSESELGKAEEPNNGSDILAETNSEITNNSKPQENVLGLENPPVKIKEPRLVNLEADSLFKLEDPYSLLAKLPFTPLDIYFSSETEIIAVGPYDVSRINLNTQQISALLTKSAYLDIFKKEMPLITSSNFQGGTNIVLGFSNGEVIQHLENNWKVLPGGPAYSNDRVNSIIDHDGKILIGSKGIYIWELDLNRFMSSQESKTLSINSILAINSNFVIFVTPDALVSLSFPEKAINSFFSPLNSEQPILSLEQEGDNLLVGTIRGILRISKSGEILSRFASGYSVSKITKLSDNNFMVLTDKGPGILINDEVFTDSTLSNGKVTSISTHPSQEIILGLISGEIIKTSFADFEKKFKKQLRKEIVKEVFPNACRAYEKLLGRLPYSHQLSYIEIESEPFVFMDGKQVCPNGAGQMDKFGNAIVSKENVFIRSVQGKFATITPADEVLAAKPTIVMISKEGRLYVGTENGLFIGGDKSWDRVKESRELSEDLISDILEDYRGNIWVSTKMSSKEAEQDSSNYSPLHIQIGESWAHFGKSNGLSAFGISDLSSSNQDILMSSSRGFSILTPKSELNFYGRATGLKRYRIESVNRDRRGRIWIGSGFFLDGISWVDNDKIYNIAEKNGLFSNRISRVGVDENDRVWIIDSAGKTGVYDYQSLVEMAEVSNFYAYRAEKTKFLP